MKTSIMLMLAFAVIIAGCGGPELQREETHEEYHYRPTYGGPGGPPPTSSSSMSQTNTTTSTNGPAPTTSSSSMSSDVPSWAHETVVVEGNGTGRGSNPAQQRLMARRGAWLDAARNFLEYARGLQIDSNTYVKDFVTESDEITGRAQGWVKHGRIISEQYNPDGTYTMKVETPLWELWQYVKTVRREYK